MKIRRYLIFVFFLSLFSSLSSAVTLQDLRYRSYPEKTRIVIDLDRISRYVVEPTSSGTISVTIPNLTTKPSQYYWPINDGLIKNILVLQYSSEVRLIINLEKSFKDYRAFSLRDPPRVVIDVWKGSPVAERTPSIFLKTVVIDAGHGGKDPGALGPTGLREKTVTLQIAKMVREILQRHGVRVIMTREHDRFVSLRERVFIANSEGADLFLSIHCNASFSSRATGFESYFLSPASDDLARAVAAVENSVIMMEDSSYKEKEFLTILADLKYAEYRKESKMLAEIIQTNLSRTLSTPNRGVKSALFYVLKGLDAPAVLVEVGFISNPREERKLRQILYRRRIADALAQSILKFKREFDLTAGFTR